MRLFVGRRIGPVFAGASVGPFHPSRLFIEHGSGGYRAHGWFVAFGFLSLGAVLWLISR